jgi:hypothetical protein
LRHECVRRVEFGNESRTTKRFRSVSGDYADTMRYSGHHRWRTSHAFIHGWLSRYTLKYERRLDQVAGRIHDYHHGNLACVYAVNLWKGPASE